ncbi:MAG TPA: PRC-barrel domain-containing protein [Streptosporangiaceae bacterium]|nr:PRC-barrel domain-containing protein [Streptosporangiaceae bacterium]
MAEEAFTIGAGVSCADGICGELTRVVVDPVARAVTHLVVEPQGRQGLARLVPIGLAEATDTDTGERIRFRGTLAEFEHLDPAEETQFVPGTQGYAAYGPEQVLSWPYASLGGGPGVPGDALAGTSETVTYDTIPVGEVEIGRGEHVHATDGAIGHVEGLVIDPRNHQVTHVLLQEGHLWGRKEVAIPVGAVARTDDGIRLSLSRREVADLPPVDIQHPGGGAQ